jgi:hypothetical protein
MKRALVAVLIGVVITVISALAAIVSAVTAGAHAVAGVMDLPKSRSRTGTEGEK